MKTPQFNSLEEMATWLAYQIKALEKLQEKPDLSFSAFLKDQKIMGFYGEAMNEYIAEKYYNWRKEQEHPLNDIFKDE